MGRFKNYEPVMMVAVRHNVSGFLKGHNMSIYTPERVRAYLRKVLRPRSPVWVEVTGEVVKVTLDYNCNKDMTNDIVKNILRKIGCGMLSVNVEQTLTNIEHVRKMSMITESHTF